MVPAETSRCFTFTRHTVSISVWTDEHSVPHKFESDTKLNFEVILNSCVAH